MRIEPAEQQKQRRVMLEMANELDRFLNGAAKGVFREKGFLILLFEHDDAKDESRYLSNTNRPHAIRIMERAVESLRGKVAPIPEEQQHAAMPAEEPTAPEAPEEPEGEAA